MVLAVVPMSGVDTASKEDLTGRGRLAKNVGASYLGQVVFIVVGFILPRAISDSVGQVALGTWDLAWSFVSYLNLAMLGIGSSVNRYVARYRASKEVVALNSIVSTVVAVQLAIAIVVLLASIVIAWFVPLIFAERLGPDAANTRWIVGLLGASLAIQMAFDAWRGVLTGCHRWDYYNLLNAGSYGVISVAMLTVLSLGYGLVGMATIYLAGTLLTELLRYKIARGVCNELSLSTTLINRGDAVKVIKFGSKSILLGLPAIITQQTVSIFVVAFLGPAALAILSRPLALVKTITMLVAKYSYILVPTAGSLQSQGKHEELRQFALQSCRTGLLLSIPPLAFMFVIGDLVLDVWMGPDYAIWAIGAILAGGDLLVVSQSALLRILVGMNVHGRVAKLSAISSALLVIVGLVVASFVGWSLEIAAALIVLPAGIGIGGSIAYCGFQELKIDVAQYLRFVVVDGIILLASLCAALWAVRWYSPYPSIVTLAIGSLTTGLIVVGLHWRDGVAVYQALRNK